MKITTLSSLVLVLLISVSMSKGLHRSEGPSHHINQRSLTSNSISEPKIVSVAKKTTPSIEVAREKKKAKIAAVERKAKQIAELKANIAASKAKKKAKISAYKARIAAQKKADAEPNARKISPSTKEARAKQRAKITAFRKDYAEKKARRLKKLEELRAKIASLKQK